MMKRIIYLLLPLLASCGENSRSSLPTRETVSDVFLQEVLTAKAELKRLQKEFTLAGKVVVDSDRTISYSPLVSGVVVKSYFSLGDYAEKGKRMVDIRSVELSSLQSELAVARQNLKGVESLHESGMATDKELVEARSTVGKLQSDFVLYGENQDNGVFSVKAPMSGYVIGKYCNPGTSFPESGGPLFSMADLSTVWVVANVYAGNLQFVHEGQCVEITSVAYPAEVFKGKIDFLSQVFDSEDKALKVRITLPNPALKLKPEMPVVVKLFNDSNLELVAVPSSAVIFDNNGYYVVVGDKSFGIRKITPFARHNDFTYITEGIKAGEEVVIKNQLLMYNDIKGK